jgi:uncharacterized membrane protein YdfJ with MMPL/SSD domain
MTSPVAPESRGPLARLGGLSARHPVVTVVVWALLLAAALATAVGGVTGDTLFERLQGDPPSVDGESSRADDLLGGDAGERESLTLLVHGVDPADAEAGMIAADLAERVADLDSTTLVAPFGVPPLPSGEPDPRVGRLLAEDGDGFLLTVTVEGAGDAEPDATAVDAAHDELDAAADDYRDAYPDAIVEVGGARLLVDSILEVSENDLRRGEGVALPIALVVMLVVFGGFLAAGIPLVGAGAAIGGGLGLLFGVTQVTDIDSTVINVVTAVGLGLSIDYGLLMVSRFREEYRPRVAAEGASRGARLAAISRTAGTAGRTVFYSGLVFLIASAGLLVFEPRMVRAVGMGAIGVTLIAILSAMTLVPALLSLTGDRLARPGLLTRVPGVGRWLTRFGDVAPEEGFFSRLARRVQRHPAIVTLGCVAVLVLVGTPLATLTIANTSLDATPRSATAYPFIDAFDEHFPAATTPRVALVTADAATGEDWADHVAGLPHVDEVGPTVEVGDGWQTVVRIDDPGNGTDVVRHLRADRDADPGLEDALVTGSDARTVDLTDALVRGAPWAALVLALGTIILLFLMTGSLVIPLKALVASALSLGASVGVLVWGFEYGNFAGIMNFEAERVHGVDVLVLVLTFIFGFGLAMDYELFILSRIVELKAQGVSDEEAIARGLQRSGRIITSAALIIIVVFAGFATGDLMVIKQLGTALAVAVLLDATIVRCLLVPAFMTWQRRILWWAPRWMKRLHTRFGLSH